MLAVATVLLAALLPVLRSTTPVSRFRGDIDSRSTKEVVQAIALESITGLWFLAVGAALGSFLNVVVYRMPRRESVIWRPSYCPRCHSPIRLSDNLPMWGWVRLKGHCRDCWLPISLRYPLVELALGWMFFGLAQWELLSGGANLPVREIHRLAGAMYVLWDPHWQLIAIFCFHGLLVFMLSGWALMAWDGRRPPWYYAAFSIAAGALLPLWKPYLHPLPACDVNALQWLNVHLSAGPQLTSAAGIVAGALLGWLGSLSDSLRWREASSARSIYPSSLNSIFAMAMVGAFLGWQAVLWAGLITSLIQLLARLEALCLSPELSRERYREVHPDVNPEADRETLGETPPVRPARLARLGRMPWVAALGIGAFITLLGWRWLWAAKLMPEGQPGWWIIALPAGMLLMNWMAQGMGNRMPAPPCPTRPAEPSSVPHPASEELPSLPEAPLPPETPPTSDEMPTIDYPERNLD